MNNILFKVFGAMSKDSCSYIYECFGIDTADQFNRKRQDKFINKFCASDNLSCRVTVIWQAVTDVNFELSFLYLCTLCSFSVFVYFVVFSVTTCLVK